MTDTDTPRAEPVVITGRQKLFAWIFLFAWVAFLVLIVMKGVDAIDASYEGDRTHTTIDLEEEAERLLWDHGINHISR